MDDDISTETMQRLRRWYWVGDWMHAASEAAPTAGVDVFAAHYAIAEQLCRLAIPDATLIGIRPSTTRERHLSRFRPTIHSRMRSMRSRRTSHLICLVDTGERRAQLMFSASLDRPEVFEWLDVDRATRTRFLLWVCKSLCVSHDLQGFFGVWIDAIMPRCHESRDLKRLRVSSRPWVVPALRAP